MMKLQHFEAFTGGKCLYLETGIDPGQVTASEPASSSTGGTGPRQIPRRAQFPPGLPPRLPKPAADPKTTPMPLRAPNGLRATSQPRIAARIAPLPANLRLLAGAAAILTVLAACGQASADDRIRPGSESAESAPSGA